MFLWLLVQPVQGRALLARWHRVHPADRLPALCWRVEFVSGHSTGYLSRPETSGPFHPLPECMTQAILWRGNLALKTRIHRVERVRPSRLAGTPSAHLSVQLALSPPVPLPPC